MEYSVPRRGPFSVTFPVKVGDTLDDEKAAAAIKALYATGFFKDVRLEAEDGVLVVVIEERPAIAQISIIGAKEFEKDKLKEGLKQAGLAESRIFDRSMLERAEQELKQQYISRGKYAVKITTTTTPMERNRVAINFHVDEGKTAKIRKINIVGNKAFKEKDLLTAFVLRTPGLLTWFTKEDQYSKQKLGADLESLDRIISIVAIWNSVSTPPRYPSRPTCRISTLP